MYDFSNYNLSRRLSCGNVELASESATPHDLVASVVRNTFRSIIFPVRWASRYPKCLQACALTHQCAANFTGRKIGSIRGLDNGF
jgi:hypothetical protein